MPLDCLTADGNSRYRMTVSMGTWSMDPAEYTIFFYGISVVAQFVAFLLCGSLGDYGGLRKQVYAVSTWVGCAACVCCFAVTTERWYLGGVFLIIGNLAFGISVLMYESWLPLLVEAHWDFLALGPITTAEERRVASDEIGGSISSKGFAWGYMPSFHHRLQTPTLV